MPNWSEVAAEINSIQPEDPLTTTRRKYLRIMHEYTGRNIIAYYSGFMQNAGSGTSIDDNDKNALMQMVHGLDKSLGLDLILHTPGGDVAATESLIHYLRSIFGTDIRTFVPQMAMSGGTLIALSGKEIVMGKQSNLGPIDPQYGPFSCHGVIEEFDKAVNEIKNDPDSAPVWIEIISKYHPTFIGDCQKAIDWAASIAENALTSNMFKDEDDPKMASKKVVDMLANHQKTYSHSKHIHADECEELGLKITRLEDMDKTERGGCKDLQDCVLTIHHTYMQSMAGAPILKAFENHKGASMFLIIPPSN